MIRWRLGGMTLICLSRSLRRIHVPDRRGNSQGMGIRKKGRDKAGLKAGPSVSPTTTAKGRPSAGLCHRMIFLDLLISLCDSRNGEIRMGLSCALWAATSTIADSPPHSGPAVQLRRDLSGGRQLAGPRRAARCVLLGKHRSTLLTRRDGCRRPCRPCGHPLGVSRGARSVHRSRRVQERCAVSAGSSAIESKQSRPAMGSSNARATAATRF